MCELKPDLNTYFHRVSPPSSSLCFLLHILYSCLVNLFPETRGYFTEKNFLFLHIQYSINTIYTVYIYIVYIVCITLLTTKMVYTLRHIQYCILFDIGNKLIQILIYTVKVYKKTFLHFVIYKK